MALLLLAGLACLASLQAASAAPAHRSSQHYCPVFYTEPPTKCLQIPSSFLSFSSDDLNPPIADMGVLENAVEALMVLQNQYFDSDYGTWPSSIDWTAAVAGTVVSGMLTTLSKSLASTDLGGLSNWKAKENLISSFYAQVVGSYFGQDVLSIRGQAYDDILWVALGWIESIKFVRTHADLHYPRDGHDGSTATGGLQEILDSIPWHGHNWVTSFAHRARIFWNAGARGWDTRFCNGGMVWNPRLNPYKNAITNELWIAASISMYEHFPGDNFTAPWIASLAFPTKDPAHLDAAIEGYGWLMDVNMTNHRGLFVDGYHIDRGKPGNTKCDLRDEMVYTYNQGVLLTGQRGLWAVSGSPSYLEDGHVLVQSAIEATGWDLKENKPVDDLDRVHFDRLPPWRGLGRGGIMEEQCDASGTCSQDGQTFKGIFFHHLATFCAPLDPILVERGRTVDLRGYRQVKTAHATACKSYLGWIKHNAGAALGTRDDAGRFGMWWGAGIFDAVVTLDDDGIDHNAENTTDYRNLGTPEDDTWGEHHRWVPGTGGWNVMKHGSWLERDSDQQVLTQLIDGENSKDKDKDDARETRNINEREDPNERGRGRTVETQVGGLALLKAYWEISQYF
ncbi:Fc.00g023390.m01.CDS01 [Cosmosporella sp. VM-42]